jgi:hypothetical protein
VLHLRDEVHQEEERPIAHPRQAGAEAPIESLLLGLAPDLFLNLLPLDAERRVREQAVERLARQPVGRERVAKDDVADVLPLDEHVGLADRIRLGVQLLPEHDEPRARVVVAQVLARHAQHAPGARGRIVERADHAALRERVVVFDEDQIHHQADDLPRGEVLSRGFVRELGELADQLLEDVPPTCPIWALLIVSGWRLMPANFSVTR